MKFFVLIFTKKRDISIGILLLVFIPLFLFAFNAQFHFVKMSEKKKTTIQSSLGIETTRVTPLPSSAPTEGVSTPTPNTSNQVYLGMWTEGLWDESTYTLHPEALSNLQNLIGKKVAIAHYYRGWENLGHESIVSELQTLSNNGWRPMLSANPYFFSQCQQNGKSIYKTIADGGCDSFLQTIGNNLKQFGKPVFLRFAWEMNIDAIEWSIQKTNSTPEEFVQAWKRFHDVVVNQGASNVLWVWSPNVQTAGSIAYTALYPGDSYVDWLGLDGYNWGNTQTWTHWESFSEIFRNSYSQITTLAPTKPLMIAEVNTTDSDGDKAAWYQDMLTTQIPFNFPRIKAVVFYNENRSEKEHVNWLINASENSLNAFSQFIKGSSYLSSF